MSASDPALPRRSSFSGFDSSDTQIIFDDGPGDNTTRPARPVLLRLALAERERIERWKHLLKRQPSGDQPSDAAGGPANSGS
jgi:hypothetical protein